MPIIHIMTTASVQARDPLAAHRHRGPKTKGRRRRSGRWGLGWSCSPPTGGAAALEPRWRLAGRRPRGSDRASSWPARCRSTGGPVGGAPSWSGTISCATETQVQMKVDGRYDNRSYDIDLVSTSTIMMPPAAGGQAVPVKLYGKWTGRMVGVCS